MGTMTLRLALTSSPRIIQLSGLAVDEDAANGTEIGVLSVSNGTGYTFTITSDPDSKFTIVGSSFRKNAAMDFDTAAQHSVTIRAAKTGEFTLSQTFIISVNDVSVSNTEVTQFGITLTLQGAVTVGQFWNGDYYAVGACKVLTQSPAWDGTRNGCMINPAAGGNQGYDTRALNYSAAVRAVYGSGSGGLGIDLVPGDSFVVAKSYSTNPTGGAASKIEDAMILTCLAAAPASPSTTFRPPYVAGAKPLWTFADINYALLPDETAPFIPNLTAGTQTFLKRPYIDHGSISGTNTAQIHPNSQGLAYPQFLSSVVSQLAVLAMTNDAQRNEAAHRLIQFGIDGYHVSLGNDKGWRAQAGIGGQGRKGAIIFAGILLEDDDMKNVAKFTASVPTGYKFSEDGHTYQGDTKARWGSDDATFTGSAAYFSNHDKRDPTGQKDCTPHGADPFVTTPAAGVYIYGNTIHTSVGIALAISMLPNGRTVWDHAPFFAFIHRWTHEDLWDDLPIRSGSAYEREIYQFGGGPLGTSPLSTDTHGTSGGGTYPQSFMKYMFDNYWVAP